MIRIDTVHQHHAGEVILTVDELPKILHLKDQSIILGVQWCSQVAIELD